MSTWNQDFIEEIRRIHSLNSKDLFFENEMKILDSEIN